MTVDTSKIDNLPLREKVRANWRKRQALQADVDTARQPFAAELAQAMARRHNAVEAIDAEWRTEREAIIERRRAATAAQQQALDAFDEADSDADTSDVAIDEDGDPLTCCVTGFVILDTDKLVEDEDGRKAIAAALGWPEFDDEEESDDEDEDIEEEAA